MSIEKLKQYVECPECDGCGEITRAVATGVDEEYENEYETCEECDGRGVIKKGRIICKN